MNDRALSMPAQASVACARLPGLEAELPGREMANTLGGLTPIGTGPIMTTMVWAIAEAIIEYFDDKD